MTNLYTVATMIRLPVRNRKGETLKYALIDDEDAHLAQYNWFVMNKKYVGRSSVINGKKTCIYLHREIMGHPVGIQVDHEDRNPLNNRRYNLRLATYAEQRQNQGPVGGTSKYRGVYWNKQKGKWHARAMLNRKQHHVGFFDDEDEAGRAASCYRLENMPFATE